MARPLWPHQERALAAVGAGSTYLVLSPGGGKTLIGLEAIRRLGRPAMVPATGSRDLSAPLTVLTYQAVCTLDAAPARGLDSAVVTALTAQPV